MLVPVINLAVWRRRPLGLEMPRLLLAGAFAAAFGFVEAAVVVYLRSALGLAGGERLMLQDVEKLATMVALPADAASQTLMRVEVAREAATIIMLVSVAMLAARALRDRWAAFLWMFAIWDIVYYAGLWATVGWPASLLDADVLFLIPVPWLSQVWFPLLVSLLCVGAVLAGRRSRGGFQKHPERSEGALPQAESLGPVAIPRR